MLNPHTATDAEVDDFLATHCNEEYDVDDWHPTRDYNVLRRCEEKMQGRWRIVLRRLSNGNWYAETDRKRFNGKWFIHADRELSARARLIMAVMQEESR